jgi:hypothetical protein
MSEQGLPALPYGSGQPNQYGMTEESYYQQNPGYFPTQTMATPPQQTMPSKRRIATKKVVALVVALVVVVVGVAVGVFAFTRPTAQESQEQAAFAYIRANAPALHDASDDKLRTLMQGACSVIRNDGPLGLMGYISEFNLGPGDVGTIAGKAMQTYCTDAKSKFPGLP